MSKKLFLVFFLLILAEAVSAATIHGSVYDLSLNKITDVKLEIDTTPKQTYISKQGTYEFSVPVGTYTIKASQYKGTILEASASEQISVKDEGVYVLDLVLFPELIEENELVEEGDEISTADINGNGDYTIYYWIAGLVVVGFAAYYLLRKKKPKKEPEKHEEKPVETKHDLDKIVEILKQEGGRSTQKEIRKHFPLSEGKVSLMITELEHKGIVKRIKKGRGNIIILQK